MPSLNPLVAQAIVVDGDDKTDGAYCKEQTTEKVSDVKKKFERVDVVFNVYKVMSLKYEVREGRSKGHIWRNLVRYDTPIQHSKFQKSCLN